MQTYFQWGPEQKELKAPKHRRKKTRQIFIFIFGEKKEKNKGPKDRSNQRDVFLIDCGGASVRRLYRRHNAQNKNNGHDMISL